MRAPLALISFIAVLSSMLAYAPAFAQDVAPETPPELRDFRLDPQPARPTVQPTVEPAPVTTPPPAVATVPDADASAPTVRGPDPAPTRRATPEPVSVSPPSNATADNVGSTSPMIESAPAITNDPAPEVSDPQAQPASATINQSWWQIAAALGLIAIMLIALYLFRRFRKTAIEADTAVAEPEAVAEPPKAVSPVNAAPRLAPSKSQSKSRVAIDFIPEKATISFTALTIKGQLRVINGSGAVAKNMRLRAALISASAHQDAEIAAFHLGSEEIPAQDIGDAGAGERIGMAIELTVPLADLQSFPLGDQQLFVPLMVANIVYGGDGGASSEVAQIACMIGREASPPKPKMAPLRLDLGPRSFSPLGQRPVLTA